jgi:hypothetical protein
MSDNDEIGKEAVENTTPDKGAEPEYKVGYCKPPLETRFPPGSSGNPRGRPCGRPNLKTMVESVAYRKVPVRQGEQTHLMTLFEAVLFGLGLKGAKGDHRPASAFIKAVKDVQEIQAANFLEQPANIRPSAGFFINLDEALLSEDDLAELSRLAQIVDLGGDITALNLGDFARLQQIVNKGRGKDITPQP